MDERIREMRLKLDKIAWEPEQSEKNKRAFDFIVVYSDYLIQQAERVEELEIARKFWYDTFQEQAELSRGQKNKLQEQVWKLEEENIGMKHDLKDVIEQLESVSDVVWESESNE